MKQQVDFFKGTFDAFDKYASVLASAARAIATGDQSEDLMVSLMRDENDVLPSYIIDKLNDGADFAAMIRPRVTQMLAKAMGDEAKRSVRSGAKSLDRQLETTLDLQAPPHARVAPPHIYFKPIQEQLRVVFPRSIGDPADTPTVLAFQKFLEGPDNPWR
ncbi:hypothetical protein [Tritonibacter mobilis]|uniref:hypothetical protein n=1 Tax=Tritonibacter mobilis TaxID=379347 RepID=UPI000E0D74F4|nr:hypothetical protein [Tritonibacter mobilis]NKX37531.1 hypothetical protein [Rhodobacteraceae bacterium R_SAG4]